MGQVNDLFGWLVVASAFFLFLYLGGRRAEGYDERQDAKRRSKDGPRWR